MAYTIEVNHVKRTADVDGDMPLLWVLRDELNLKGPKFGCGAGLCGACTVHLDGQAVRSCITPISSVGSAAVATIEGMADDPVGKKLQAVVVGARCPAMRILPGRADHVGDRAADQKPAPKRRGDRRGNGRQCLPMLLLYAHPRRDQKGGDHAQRGGGVAAMAFLSAKRAAVATGDFSPSRRIFLKASAAAGGGLLLHAILPAAARAAMADGAPAAGQAAPLNAFIRIATDGDRHDHVEEPGDRPRHQDDAADGHRRGARRRLEERAHRASAAR